MKRRNYIYPILLLGIFSAFIVAGDAIFGYSKPDSTDSMQKHKVENKPEYKYISPYARLSHYDEHFRAAADSIGYDWKLFAAIAFTESRFDSTVVSEAGACGVMQMMPSTLRGFKVPDSLYNDNRTNIMAAARLLEAHDNHFRRIKNPEERMKFILASYNAGYGHIIDAMKLAEKYGYDKHVWTGSVDSFLIKKSLPEYYTDTLCLNGEFKNWKQTFAFVKQVYRHWARFNNAQERYNDSIEIVMKNDTLIKIAVQQPVAE